MRQRNRDTRVFGHPSVRLATCLALLSLAATVSGSGQANQQTPKDITKIPTLPAPPSAFFDDSYKLAEKSKVSAQAANRFGLKLVSDLAGQQRGKNVFISPLGLFAALAMTESGAAGETQASMRQALQVPLGVSEAGLHESVGALLKTLQENRGAKVSIANALWSDLRAPVAADFAARSRTVYQAEARSLDLHQPQAAETLNAWVKQKTRGQIDHIVSPADLKKAAAVITNAVYFRGAWAREFEKTKTRRAMFTMPGARKKQVLMMHQSGLLDAYRSGKGYEAAQLDYQASTMALFVILPSPELAPEEALARVRLSDLMNAPYSTTLDLRLPRFTLDFDARLAAPLARLGMASAFRPDANFKPLGASGFQLGEVIHKTRLEVDEVGTIAAAATEEGIISGFSPPSMIRPKVLVFNRPFALLLCDLATDTIVFAGVVYDPQP